MDGARRARLPRDARNSGRGSGGWDHAHEPFRRVEPGDAEHSYLGLMRLDFVTMITALGGDPSALEAIDVADVAPDTSEYPQ